VSYNNTIRLWDGATGASIATLEGHSDLVDAVIFSPDGSKIASHDHLGNGCLWDGVTGDLISTLGSDINAFQFLSSLAQQISLSIVLDSSISLWHISGSRFGDTDLAHCVPMCWLPLDIQVDSGASFAYTASFAALGCQDGCLILFDIRNISFD
jgi:WD40 repeat protein